MHTLNTYIIHDVSFKVSLNYVSAIAIYRYMGVYLLMVAVRLICSYSVFPSSVTFRRLNGVYVYITLKNSIQNMP